MYKISKLHRAIFSVIYSISQPNFAILLILRFSFIGIVSYRYRQVNNLVNQIVQGELIIFPSIITKESFLFQDSKLYHPLRT